MYHNHKLQSFKKEVGPLLELVTKDIVLESIWLGIMSKLEEIAASSILNNISAGTPDESLRKIIEHVKDELRHAKVLKELRLVSVYPEQKYYVIEDEWKKIAENFIQGFFSSGPLREINHRHAAYVHGAQTIERFPFRVYSLYLSMTTLPDVKEKLPSVIADEQEHIELGKSMYVKLTEQERKPLTMLYSLEEELCLIMFKRMNLVLRQHLNLYVPYYLDSELEFKLTQNMQFETAWNYALSCVESSFDDRRSQYLKDANISGRVCLKKNAHYRKLENSLMGSFEKYILRAKGAGISDSTILSRFDNHYRSMIYKTNNIPIQHAYYRILENHFSPVLDINESNAEEYFWKYLKLEILQNGLV